MEAEFWPLTRWRLRRLGSYTFVPGAAPNGRQKFGGLWCFLVQVAVAEPFEDVQLNRSNTTARLG